MGNVEVGRGVGMWGELRMRLGVGTGENADGRRAGRTEEGRVWAGRERDAGKSPESLGEPG